MRPMQFNLQIAVDSTVWTLLPCRHDRSRSLQDGVPIGHGSIEPEVDEAAGSVVHAKSVAGTFSENLGHLFLLTVACRIFTIRAFVQSDHVHAS